MEIQHQQRAVDLGLRRQSGQSERCLRNTTDCCGLQHSRLSLERCGLDRCLRQSLVLWRVGICLLARAKYRVSERHLGVPGQQRTRDLVERSSDVNQNGSYPTQFSPSLGVPFVNNVAGARRGVALWQPDSLDYVWVFAGEGYDSTSTTGNGYLNDLWTYLPYP